MLATQHLLTESTCAQQQYTGVHCTFTHQLAYFYLHKITFLCVAPCHQKMPVLTATVSLAAHCMSTETSIRLMSHLHLCKLATRSPSSSTSRTSMPAVRPWSAAVVRNLRRVHPTRVSESCCDHQGHRKAAKDTIDEIANAMRPFRSKSASCWTNLHRSTEGSTFTFTLWSRHYIFELPSQPANAPTISLIICVATRY